MNQNFVNTVIYSINSRKEKKIYKANARDVFLIIEKPTFKDRRASKLGCLKK